MNMALEHVHVYCTTGNNYYNENIMVTLIDIALLNNLINTISTCGYLKKYSYSLQ